MGKAARPRLPLWKCASEPRDSSAHLRARPASEKRTRARLGEDEEHSKLLVGKRGSTTAADKALGSHKAEQNYCPARYGRSQARAPRTEPRVRLRNALAHRVQPVFTRQRGDNPRVRPQGKGWTECGPSTRGSQQPCKGGRG